MTIVVEGVRIELTTEQISLILKERKRRERCRGSFKRMLSNLGFKPCKDLPGSFEHKVMPWYAEIVNHEGYSNVWMVGGDLKSAGFPGGWIYHSPTEIETEVLKVLNTT